MFRHLHIPVWHIGAATPAPPPPPPFSYTYGAPADGGEIDDPTITAAPYDSGTSYTYGNIVTVAGVYYICIARPTYSTAVLNPTGAISGIAPAGNLQYWWPASNWYYLDSGATPGTGAGNADPTVAKAAPYSSLSEIYTLTRGSGAGTTPRYSVILGKRGQTYNGNFSIGLSSGGGKHALIYLGAWGNPASARPTVAFRNNNAILGASCILGVFSSTAPYYAGLQVCNWITDGLNAFTSTITPVSSTLTAGDTVSGGTSGATGTVLETLAANGITISWNGDGDAIHGFYQGETLTVTAGTNVGATATLTTMSAGTTGIVMYTSSVNGIGAATVRCEVKNCGGNGINIGTIAQTYSPNSGDFAYIYGCYIHGCHKMGGGSSGLSGNGAGLGVTTGDQVMQLQNTITDNGNGITSHNVYNIDLTSNCFAFNSSTNAAGGYGYNIHGNCSNILVTYNKFDGNNNGIGLAKGYADGVTEQILGGGVTYNQVINCGQTAGNTQGYGMLADIIQGNSSTPFIVANNLWESNVLGDISLSDSGRPGKVIPTYVLFAYNSFYTPSGGYGSINLNNTTLTHISVLNNSYYSLGTGSNKVCFNSILIDPTQLTCDYNQYYIPNKAGGLANQCIIWNNIAYTLAGFRAGPGAANTIDSHSQQGDPLYTAPPGDLTLQGGSPNKTKGTPVSSVTKDFAGNSRSATAPSIGAYE